MSIVSLQAQLFNELSASFAAEGVDSSFAAVVVAERPEFGDYQCNGALAAAKILGLAPRQLAEQIIGRLTTTWCSYRVAGAGFINITISDQKLAESADLLLRDPLLGIAQVERPERVWIDFGGPNVAKPLHVGHLRSGIIGDVLQRLNRIVGHHVTSDVHLGDWGTQMGMVICGIAREQPDLPYFDPAFSGPYPEASPVTLDDLERIYPAQSAICKADPLVMAAALQATVELQAGRPGYLALWQHFVTLSVASARAIYDSLGIQFDLWHGESTVNQRIPALLERLKAEGLATMSEGALIVPLDAPPPMLLLKTDGAYLYATTDLATIEERVEQGVDTIHYVVDQRQALHFSQLFTVARRSGIASPELKLQFHGFGTINGPDGKPFKTRAGGVMRLVDLIELVENRAAARLTELEIGKAYPEAERAAIIHAVGLAALKFADLSSNKSSDYTFDLERFTSFEGKTGPYLLYTAVRASSILRTMQISSADLLEITQIDPLTRPVLILVVRLAEEVAVACATSSPHILCEFAFTLAQSFNRFYQQTSILHESDQQLQQNRLALTRLISQELTMICSLLGITIPERM